MPIKGRYLGFLQRQTSGVVIGTISVFVLSLVLQWKYILPSADDIPFVRWALSNQTVQPDWGPLYVYFIGAISWLPIDKETVFRVAIIVIAAISSILIYLWIYNRTGDKINSGVFTSIYLLSAFSPFATRGINPFLPPSSMSGHFALIFVAGGVLILARFGARQPHILAAVSLCFVIGTYSRPEFLFVAVFSCCFTAFKLVTQWNRPSTLSPYIVRTTTLIVLCIILSLVLALGVPLPTSERAHVAFGQHSALSYCNFFPSDCTDYPDASVHWKLYYQMLFKESPNVFEAAINYPTAFFGHLLRNTLMIAVNIPYGIFGLISSKLILIRVLNSIIIVIFVWRFFKTIKHKKWKKPDMMLSVFIFLAIFPQIVNWFYLYPRMHYMITPCILGWGLILSFAAKSDAGDNKTLAEGA